MPLQANFVVIATGSRATRPKELRPGVPIPFTSRRVVDATQVRLIECLIYSLYIHKYINNRHRSKRPATPLVHAHVFAHICIMKSIDCIGLTVQMANLKELPHSLAVIGGGVIGVEYATILAEVGVQTSILCKVSHFILCKVSPGKVSHVPFTSLLSTS
jgi:NADPH-dependent 2,4-dienoyl-CoA reductase/sulfur reductase-like enzyme